MCRYIIGKIIGSGSFGVVREAIQKGTGIRFAVKSVPKVPKRGVPTPRYLLKLRQEVDAMTQLGASLDAVYLAVRSLLQPAARWRQFLGAAALPCMRTLCQQCGCSLKPPHVHCLSSARAQGIHG